MRRDLMPGSSSLRDEGRYLSLLPVATTKKVAFTPARFSADRTSGVVLLGPSSKVRQTHFSGIGSGSGDVSTEDAEAGETKLSSGTGVRSLSRSLRRLRAAEYPQSEPRRRPDRKQQKAPQQSLMFAGSEKSHFQKPPS